MVAFQEKLPPFLLENGDRDRIIKTIPLFRAKVKVVESTITEFVTIDKPLMTVKVEIR